MNYYLIFQETFALFFPHVSLKLSYCVPQLLKVLVSLKKVKIACNPDPLINNWIAIKGPPSETKIHAHKKVYIKKCKFYFMKIIYVGLI